MISLPFGNVFVNDFVTFSFQGGVGNGRIIKFFQKVHNNTTQCFLFIKIISIIIIICSKILDFLPRLSNSIRWGRIHTLLVMKLWFRQVIYIMRINLLAHGVVARKTGLSSFIPLTPEVWSNI